MSGANVNTPGSSYTINIPLWNYLLMRGLAYARNVSFTIAANTTDSGQNNAIKPDSGHPYIFIKSIQFDGVQSGLVGYNITCDGNEIAGFAIQGIEDEIGLFNRGRMKYEIQNNQSSQIVVNIDYLTVPADSMNIDVIQALYAIQSGGRYAMPGA